MKKKSLAKQFEALFILFTLVTILVSSLMNYLNQTRMYHRSCVESLQQMTSHLSGLIQAEGDEFVNLKQWFSAHTEEVQIPLDFREDLPRAKSAFQEYISAHYPGRAFGVDLRFEELDHEAQKLYVNYRFEHWFKVFTDSSQEFELSYVYFLYPEEDKDHVMNYMLDATMTPVTTPDGKVILFLGDQVYEDPAEFKYMWNAWDSGTPQDGFDSMDNEFGYVYTYCYPLLIDGEKVGLVCADISVDRVNSEILATVVGQTLVSLAILAVATYLLYLFLNRRILKRIGWLENQVETYAQDKLPAISQEILDNRGQEDELGSLAGRFAGMITELDEYMLNLQQVTAEKERIGAELSVATQIQADFLPKIFPVFNNTVEFDIYATMTPAKEVGGDFYDFFYVDDHHLALVIADVSGKGVPAALFMVISKTLIKNRLMSGDSPAQALMNVNEQLCEGNEAEYFVTVWAAVVDLRTGEVVEANAGHEYPALCQKDGSYELVRTKHSPAVAIMEGMRFRERSFRLNPGDRLFVYTDGVTEATDAQNQLFGEERLVTALNQNPGLTQEKLLASVRESIDTFVGEAPQFDDLTMLGFEFRGEQK